MLHRNWSVTPSAHDCHVDTAQEGSAPSPPRWHCRHCWNKWGKGPTRQHDQPHLAWVYPLRPLEVQAASLIRSFGSWKIPHAGWRLCVLCYWHRWRPRKPDLLSCLNIVWVRQLWIERLDLMQALKIVASQVLHGDIFKRLIGFHCDCKWRRVQSGFSTGGFAGVWRGWHRNCRWQSLQIYGAVVARGARLRGPDFSELGVRPALTRPAAPWLLEARPSVDVQPASVLWVH